VPIRFRVDAQAKVVVAAAYGTLTDDDVFGYQLGVWSRPDLAGYDELIDMTRVEEITLPSTARVRELAVTSAEMDDPARSSRFAIVAPDDFAFGLGRMFQTYRELDGRSTKEVGVFRTVAEALTFLDVEGPLEMPALD
jgi:hypothetical protein